MTNPYPQLAEALQANRVEQARDLCRGLLETTPDSVELLTIAGALARQTGASENALAHFSRAVQLKPDLPELHNNLGVILQDLKRYEDAVTSYQKALALRPAYCEASCNLANTLRSLGREDEAVDQYCSAIAADPDYPDAYYNLGNALRARGEWSQAVQCYRKLLVLAPDHVFGWVNLGGSLLALNRFEEAIQAERRALEIDPDCGDAHWNLALALLTTGDYRQGWREYEWRLKDGATFPPTYAGRPRWDGSPLGGRALLLRSEQGFGDTLQFYRFAQLLARGGAKVVLECRPELLPLFAAQGDGVRIVAMGDALPPFDCFAYLMSLPFLLGTTLSDLPAAIPYLKADAALSAQWGARMQGGEGLKVGIAWAGSATYKNDRSRSLPLRLLVPLARMPGIEVYSLQLGSAARELAAEASGAGIRDLAPGVRDFADTAAIIANLDLVLSVDTAVAHLAGAMGCRVSLLLPHACEWRWLSGRTDSPWYPTLRLYRQERAGDWAGVLGKVMSDLQIRTSPPFATSPPSGQVGESQKSAHDNLNRRFRAANQLRCEGRTDEAMAAYRNLLAQWPDCAEIHNNLGLALQDRGNLAEAAECYRQALRLKPDLADACNNLGTVLVSQGDREAAVPYFRAALAVREDFVPACVNLGCALQHLERPEQALSLYRRAIALRPDAMEARINLGTAYQDLMQPDQAIEVYRDALDLDPLCAEAHWNLALSLLSTGDFEQGWREYEWRFDAGSTSPFSSPRWDGSELSGATILLWCEQGLGDTLQFIRYAPLVAARGGTVLVQCQYPSLKPILERVAGVSAVFAAGEQLPPFQCQAPLASLPRIFRTTLEHLPAPVPYLSPDRDRMASWRGRMESAAAFKVGLVWRGGPLPKNRACPFKEFAPLADISGIAFFSLQLGEGPLPGLLPVLDLAPGIRDFADTAAIIANLDLVLSVDTASAHLAGGMGARVWTLLPWSCDWRWLADRSDSPWYPTMRIFRQRAPGDWAGVMRDISASLGDLVQSRIC